MNSLSKIRFGSLLIYSPRGKSDVSLKSKDITIKIKNDSNGLIIKTLTHLKTNIEAFGLHELLTNDVTLVPVPKRNPLAPGGALWPAERICSALLQVGIGGGIEPCILRAKPIRKSATANYGERPSVEEHLATLACTIPTLSSKKFLLVDDVLTKGSTIFAAALTLHRVLPHVEISAFSLVRTMGLVAEVDKILDPCVGEIAYDGFATTRRP